MIQSVIHLLASVMKQSAIHLLACVIIQWAASNLRECTSNNTVWNRSSRAVGRLQASFSRHCWMKSYRKQSNEKYEVEGKGMFLYNAVSSRLTAQSALHFTPPHRPVNSDTNSNSLRSILDTQQLRTKTIHSRFHHCLWPGTHTAK